MKPQQMTDFSFLLCRSSFLEYLSQHSLAQKFLLFLTEMMEQLFAPIGVGVTFPVFESLVKLLLVFCPLNVSKL